MCLIAWTRRDDGSLLLGANRDEWLDRPALPMSWWHTDDGVEVLSGRDLRAGGTWLGLTRGGRLAAVTNVRDPSLERPQARSRGDLALRFLRGLGPLDGTPPCPTPADYAAAALDRPTEWNGFNLLLADLAAGHMVWVSNQPAAAQDIGPGVHAVSNAALDTPWPKVLALRSAVASAPPDPSGSFALLAAALADPRPAPDADLPRTGVSLEWERILSAAWIRAAGYGTRCTTLVALQPDGELHVREIQHPGGDAADFRWRLNA